MYHPPPPKEPSGCIQTLIISRMILQILFVPILMIVGGIMGFVALLYAFSYSPFLALFILALGVGALIALGKWEWRRVGKEISSEDDFYRPK
ncbi:MAG TPA: hypothetical protein VFY10_09345 [Dehalococcoidia bacterium]|jgi:hypothetical protein|nr:hypothetical protein [Dehalococcoidia bacterium]